MARVTMFPVPPGALRKNARIGICDALWFETGPSPAVCTIKRLVPAPRGGEGKLVDRGGKLEWKRWVIRPMPSQGTEGSGQCLRGGLVKVLYLSCIVLPEEVGIYSDGVFRSFTGHSAPVSADCKQYFAERTRFGFFFTVIFVFGRGFFEFGLSFYSIWSGICNKRGFSEADWTKRLSASEF